MTEKDYQTMARIIHKHSIPFQDTTGVWHIAILVSELIAELSQLFKEDDPEFDKERFKVMCLGVTK